jgi:DNA-binding MarR family transcriptional regulator
MKKVSLKQRILEYLRKGDEWVNGGTLERLAESVGYKASNASRRARELENEGLIERKVEKGENSRVKSVWYHATGLKNKIEYSLEDGTKVFTKYEY